MSTISNWSTTAASNNSAPPNGAPEAMLPSAVNNVMRQNMAELAKWYQDTNGTLTSSGTGAAYVLATNQAETALAAGQEYSFKAHLANTTTTPTLAVDGLTAKTITKNGAAALVIGDMVLNSLVTVIYDGTQFQLISHIETAEDSTVLKDADIGVTVQAYDADLDTVSSNGVGTGNNQIVQLNASGELPAVSGANLTGLESGGKVLKVADIENVTYSTLSAINATADDDIPQITDGGLLVSGSYTPLSATSTMYLFMEGNCDSNGNTEIAISLYKTGTSNALATSESYHTITMDGFTCQGKVASVGTSAITLSARAVTSDNVTLYLNGDSSARKWGGKLAQRIRVIEVEA